MDAAWEPGSTHFDTADAYGGGRSEQAIGAGSARRGRAAAADDQDLQPDGRGRRPRARARPDEAPAALEPRAARRRPRSTSTWPTTTTPTCRSPDSCGGARGLYATSGLIGAPTASATSTRAQLAPDAATRARRCDPELLLAARTRDDEAELLPLCAARGVAYIAFSPLAGGWLTGKYRRGEPFPAGLADDPAPRRLHRFVARPRVRRARRARAAGRRARHLDGRAGARLAARRPRVTAVVVGPGPTRPAGRPWRRRSRIR